MQSNYSLKQFLLRLLRPYWFYLCLLAFIGLIWAVGDIVIPYFLKLIIDKASSFSGSKEMVFSAIQIYILFYVVSWAILFCMFRSADIVKLKLIPSLRQKVMQQMFVYLNLHSHQYFQNNFAGSLVNKIVDMQDGIANILRISEEAYCQGLAVIIAVSFLLIVHPIFAVILAAWVFMFLLVTFLYLRPIQNLSLHFSQARSFLVGQMVDSISNIASVRLFAKHSFENKRMDISISDTVTKDRKMQAKIIWMRIFWDISILILLGANIWMLGLKYSQDQVTLGDFTFIMVLSTGIMWRLWFLAGQFISFSEQIGKCRQALSVLRVSHQIKDTKEAKDLLVGKGEIAFKDVSFHYDKGTKLFKNKNVLIHSGEKVGLVGFSGSGKSSFVNLILRLFEVESGSICIDNQDIRKVSQDSLRENIAFIPQDIALFHRSLMENIRYGALSATDEEVMNASKKAHCHEFISELPDGYETLVGERGIKLSGGQRQRIAIARALLKNAPILILDEATASLDSVTEKYIQETLHHLMQTKTTLVIAHRLSTLMEMDRILVFDKGKIIEDGTQSTLIQKNGHYAKMWKMQAGGFLPE